MPVEVVLLEALANSVTAWMPGELFPCVDQVEADRMIERGLAIAVASNGANPDPEVETSTEEAPKAKKRK
jgi:hypothetical protein